MDARLLKSPEPPNLVWLSVQAFRPSVFDARISSTAAGRHTYIHFQSNRLDADLDYLRSLLALLLTLHTASPNNEYENIWLANGVRRCRLKARCAFPRRPNFWYSSKDTMAKNAQRRRQIYGQTGLSTIAATVLFPPIDFGQPHSPGKASAQIEIMAMARRRLSFSQELPKSWKCKHEGSILWQANFKLDALRSLLAFPSREVNLLRHITERSTGHFYHVSALSSETGGPKGLSFARPWPMQLRVNLSECLLACCKIRRGETSMVVHHLFLKFKAQHPQCPISPPCLPII